MTFSIECYTRNQGYLYLFIVGKGFSDRFHDMKSTLTQISDRLIATQFHCFVVEHLGQQNCFPRCHQFVDQLMRADFIRKGIVSHNDGNPIQKRAQTIQNRKRQLPQLD